MKTDPKIDLQKLNTQAKSLNKVLGQSEQVKDIVEECAKGLSSVNTDLKQELRKR